MDNHWCGRLLQQFQVTEELHLLMQIIDVPERPGSSDSLEYDPEWLAILKATNSLQSTTPQPWNPPEKHLHERYATTASLRTR